MTIGHARAHDDELGEASRAGRTAARARQARHASLSGCKAADQLGISDVTLRSWMRGAKSAGAFLPVVVAEERTPQSQTQLSSSSAPTLTLRTAQGHELGPLDLETAVALLRALS